MTAPVRAVEAQCTWRMLSPGRYSRMPRNSGPWPRRGAVCIASSVVGAGRTNGNGPSGSTTGSTSVRGASTVTRRRRSATPNGALDRTLTATSLVQPASASHAHRGDLDPLPGAHGSDPEVRGLEEPVVHEQPASRRPPAAVHRSRRRALSRPDGSRPGRGVRPRRPGSRAPASRGRRAPRRAAGRRARTASPPARSCRGRRAHPLRAAGRSPACAGACVRTVRDRAARCARVQRHGRLVEHAAHDASSDLGPCAGLARHDAVREHRRGQRLHVVGQHVVASERDRARLRAPGRARRSSGAMRRARPRARSRVAATSATT